ncbi:MAG: phosphoribosylformylglycinamidine cyclo-ligase [Bacillota bacterium]
MKDEKTISYQEAGVDIDAGKQTVDLIKKHVITTLRPEVLGGVGGFGALFAVDTQKYKEPVLVSGSDGVGTKLKIAFEMDKHDTIGIDLVAMCVNDVLVQGAEPLFFLDYLAMGKLIPKKAASIVEGIAKGCRLSNMALIGGETAEMPGLYETNDYDLAGFAVGVVEKDKIIDGSKAHAGDVLIGLAASGVHSNGFSLVRKILLENSGIALTEKLPQLAKTLGEELLTPTRIYAPHILPLLDRYQIKAMAHITGGGLTDNLPRVFPLNLDALINLNSWDIPPIFHLIAEKGPVAMEEMYRTFNMGIGFVLIVAPEEEAAIKAEVEKRGVRAFSIGKLAPGTGKTVYL